MKILKKELLTNKFSHIYVEKKAFENKNTKEILKKFPNSKLIQIENYKKYFQVITVFALQKLSPKLILATKKKIIFIRS